MEHLLSQEDVDVEAQSSMKRAPIHVAAEFDRDAIAKLLLDKGATISCKDTDGFTPIHIAS